MIKPFLLLIGLLAAQYTYALTYSGRVVGVADGDTITVLDANNTQSRVRLAQIDAPEKKQAFGQRSKQSLSDLVFSRTVTVDVIGTDRDGRQIATITADGHNVNLEQVSRGLAWVYRQYARDPQFYEAETAARKERRGLWADPSPLEPWLFRRNAQ